MTFRRKCTFCITYFFQFGFSKRSCIIHYRIADQNFSVFFSVNDKIMGIEMKFIFFRKISKVENTYL